VVSGFGLASVYHLATGKFLIGRFGIQTSMVIFGVAFLIVVSILSQLLVNPPAGYKPWVPASGAGGRRSRPRPKVDYSWSEMMKTPQFYLLWIMYVFAAGAGLMIISKLAKIVQVQAGIQAGFWFVALLAIGNASGRIVAGFFSDKIGRTVTCFRYSSSKRCSCLAAVRVGPSPLRDSSRSCFGFNYGANLSLFPSATKDYFGLKNFGVNYGLVFTAWGVGGLVLPIVSGRCMT